MATDTWTGLYGGNWSDPTGWSGGTVPAAGDTVQLSQALNGPYTVHLDANEGAYAALTVSAANATLALYYGGLTLSVTGATTLSAGDIAIAGDATLDTGTFVENGGFLGMSDGTLDVSGQATLSGGGFGLYGGAFEAGSLAFAGGSFGISGGDVTATNQVSETAGTAGFYGGTFDAGSLAISGGSLGMSGGTIDASGALTLSGSGSIGIYNNAATLEAGSLSQTGGSLSMSGGTLAVTGEASFTGGTDVFYGGSTFDAGSLQIGSSNAAQTLTMSGGAVSVSGTASIAAGSTLLMYGGSFSTQGGLTDSGTITGAGTIGGPISGNGVIFAEDGTLDLTGTVASGPIFEIGPEGALTSDLKIDGTAIAAQGVIIETQDQHPELEIGSSGNLTINPAEDFYTGSVLLDGGTLTDSQGFYFGGINEGAVIYGFGTVNGTLCSTVDGAGLSGGLFEATGGTLTINGDIDQGNGFDIAAGATLVLNGAVQKIDVMFIDETSGTLVLPNATARESFESNGLISNMNFSANGAATNVLDLVDVSPTSITSAIFDKPSNTIELFSGSTMIDHFALAYSRAGGGVVHWTPDSGTGTNIFLGTT